MRSGSTKLIWKGENISFYRDQLENFLSKLTIECNFCLDIGGSAWEIGNRLRSLICKEYLIMDNEAEKELSKKWRKPDIVWDINDSLGDMHDFGKYKEHFDVILMLEVVEYIWDLPQTFRNIHWLLGDGGKLYFSAPFIYPIHNPTEIDYVRVTANGIGKILQKTGFSKWEIIPRYAKNPDLLMAFFQSDGMHPAKFEEHGITGFIVTATK